MFGRVHSIALHGDSTPSPAGRAVNACCTVKYSQELLCFANSNHIVFSIPSKSNPRIVFAVDIAPSPFISLFLDTGSFASLSSAGNTS